jgi:hypothetical protein
MRNLTLSALLLATSFAGAQTVTVGSTTSSINGNTTTITVPVQVAVPPAATVAAAVMASLRVEAGNGDGTSVTQNLDANFTTIALPRVVVDSANGWNASANTWTVPATGSYLIISSLRVVDNATPGLSYGQGVNGSNVDNPTFLWSTTNGKRNGTTNMRVMQLNAGQTVDLFAYADSSQPIALNGASLTIQQLQ